MLAGADYPHHSRQADHLHRDVSIGGSIVAPSWPWELFPHAHTVLSLLSARQWSSPQAICITFWRYPVGSKRSVTCDGTGLAGSQSAAKAPFPNWP